MNSKELMLRTFSGKKTERVPVAPHWWGMYKFQLAGLANNYDEDLSKGSSDKQMELTDIDSLFYETFRPDWLHLGGGACKTQKDPYKRSKLEDLKRELKELNSISDIEEYVQLAWETADEIYESGIYDHVGKLVSKYGDEVFIALNEGNPICSILDPDGLIGFERGMVALVERPEMMEYLIFREYDRMFERIKVLKQCGCHGYIGSETYCSADLISPETYKNIIFPTQKYFYERVKKLDMVPIVYFLGDILPLMDYINDMDVFGLMVEESKKTFHLDVFDIRKKLREDITLFGNLDSIYTLLKGSREDVVAETRRQLEAVSCGRFVMANGSPIAFNTPAANIKAMIEATREYSCCRV